MGGGHHTAIGSNFLAGASDVVFDYDEAFSRNIGWISDWEQQLLREKRVAIAGMGGVGGIHLQTLTRLGIGRFNIADLDIFELANFNRQAAANMATLGQPKVQAAAEMARAINPELQLEIFDQGVSLENLDAFLADVDLYVDSLDFFAFEIRQAVFNRCYELGIPAVTAAPIGMGTGYIVFHPDGMSFDTYFRLSQSRENALPIDFLLGLTPAMLHRPYLADGSRVDLPNKKGPSTPMSCQLCAGVAGVEAVKILLGRGPLKPAPYYHQFDPYRGKFVTAKLRWGNNGPVQCLKRFLVSRLSHRLGAAARPEEEPLPGDAGVLDRILDAARWAPSGDNSQPWRFDVQSDSELNVHLDLEHDNVYQYGEGEPNWLALGMLVEAMAIEASRWGLTLSLSPVSLEENRVKAQLCFKPADLRVDELCHWIKVRSVDRRSYQRRSLAGVQKKRLSDILGPELQIRWHEGLKDRLFFGRCAQLGTSIRLRIRETFSIHQNVIDWSGPFSRHGLPALASGLSFALRPLMRWALGSFQRMFILTQTLRGRWLAGFDLDILPAFNSGAFFTVERREPVSDCEDVIEAGRALYRFWLEATRLGLAIQPTIAPLCFAKYAEDQIEFSQDSKALSWARHLRTKLRLKNLSIRKSLFIGRIGHPISFGTAARSIRKPLRELVINDERDTV